MAFALVALGANLGDRADTLERALAALQEYPALRLVTRSTWFETTPVGGPANQPGFLNGAALWETSLPPHEFLATLQAVETSLGRRRAVRWDARTLDLDLLLYDEQVIESPNLTLPHPRLAFRRFVLAPAVEVAPAMRHPLFDWTIAKLWEHLNSAPNYLAITAAPGMGATEVAAHVADRAGVGFCADSLLPALDANTTDVEQECEVIRHRLQAVRAGLQRWPGGMVSDFWPEQSLAYWRSRPSSEQRAASEDPLAALLAAAPQPKLLAFLTTPLGGRSTFEEELRACVTRPGRGPYFVLDATAREQAVDELAAAMLAMR